ncbi:hypothetical protein C5F48_08415 [Cereibacter changlensis JA139]|uniref:DUF2189 domain-containing protein n=2 Tax=Cereibacter changlensis TaxID=402884 RepID=A0A2T4JWG8_9RHOB|nr:DUF2189 domain-containing protein [Cereibacter changlensis]PTE22226.1 hypothetical protein C5F48_08415 [Cereibacter changlensis JA139]PZX50394.1 putative membrane protein [Cereibacter changlensis]
MPKTIGNPLSWSADAVGSAVGYLSQATVSTGRDHAVDMPRVQRIDSEDLRDALRKRLEDMGYFRSDVIFVCLVYPMIGLLLATAAVQGSLHLLFPILSGFALVGPVAAVGLYEMSRRREAGLETDWSALADVVRSPRFGAILALALFHLVIFMAWVMAANLIFKATLGSGTLWTLGSFAQAVTGTPEGWAMIGLGMAVGFVFATAVLAISAVSFPLLLDRDVGLVQAVVTSVRVLRRNPETMALWGLIVASALLLGALPALLGLVLVMPLLGHASWHLYRAAVA